MKRLEIRELYGREYAAHYYDDTYLLSDLHRGDAEFELQTLERLLPSGRHWLDMACGSALFCPGFRITSGPVALRRRETPARSGVPVAGN